MLHSNVQKELLKSIMNAMVVSREIDLLHLPWVPLQGNRRFRPTFNIRCPY